MSASESQPDSPNTPAAKSADRTATAQRNARVGRVAIPTTIRAAGMFAIAQGVVGLIVAIILVVRDLQGIRTPQAEISGIGTAAWFAIVFGVILAGGIGFLRGKAWGRGPLVFFQLGLLGVAYYMFTSSRPELGVPTALIAVLGLALLFNRTSAEWLAQRYGQR